MTVDMTTIGDETDEPVGEIPPGPKELREALARKEKRITDLEAKLSQAAFTEAGYPKGHRQLSAVEKFFDGDRTDADAIRLFAADELGYTPESAADPVTPAPPSPTVSVDANLDKVAESSSTIDPTAPVDEEEKQGSERDRQLQIAQGERDNTAAMEAAMSAEIGRVAARNT